MHSYSFNCYGVKTTNAESLGSKLKNMEKGLRQDEAAPFFDRIVFDKVGVFHSLAFVQ